MKPWLTGLMVCAMLLAAGARPAPAATNEPARLGKLAESFTQAADKAADAAQKRCLLNAASALTAAQQAAEQGDEDEAVKQKKNALRWATWATKECADLGELPGQVGESLVAEGGMSEGALGRYNDLMGKLQKAKKTKKKSDFPIEQEMAIKELVNAIFDIIEHGLTVKTSKVLHWYLNAAGACDQVQEMINELLDYIETGQSISPGARDQAKKMVDDLYKMKAEGKPQQEIVDKVNEIWKFIQDEFGRVARQKLREALEEEEKETADKIASAPVTTVRFTALDGQTQVNKQFVGDVQQVRFVATDGREMTKEEVEPNLAVHDDSFTIDTRKAAGIAAIIIQGTSGVVRLVQDGAGEPASGFTGIAPKDGAIDVANGTLNETFNVAHPGEVDAGLQVGPPRDHAVNVNGQATQIVATRPDQVAVVGSGIEPTAGTSSVELVSSPDAACPSLSGRCPSWGYNISMPPTTRTDAWVPIMAEVFGLEPNEMVTFKLLPSPGQTIDKQQVTIMAGEAVAPIPIARLMTEQVGPQGLNVIVTREDGR